ncbi:hypothetical protein QNI19_32285 [Cytophagaceae bacterium DM2B3-1]|uniref:WG repeat-containing protein n=1 Tax=Xanthocytophaga flava TaxID=3048013 RepID=A0ABT7CVA3_9BACT|nr:hypothetical protein [Xanthocytophaga flavus]MDJ1497663.1 hypothetical protein [Xanthocytophaga flavus]
MQDELKESIQMFQGEEITVWQVEKKNGAVIITINQLFDDHIFDCQWLDEKQTYLKVFYTDWDSNELCAIVNPDGKIIRKGIRSLKGYIEKYQLFIVEMSGLAMGSEAINYLLSEFDWKMGVVNQRGEFIINPAYDSIRFDHDQELFYVNGGRFPWFDRFGKLAAES